MAQKNVVAPRLPAAPIEYDARFIDQLTNILRLYFTQLDNAAPILASGDVYYDTSGGAASSYPLRIKA